MSDCGRDQIFTGMNKVQFYAAFLLSASGIFELKFSVLELRTMYVLSHYSC